MLQLGEGVENCMGKGKVYLIGAGPGDIGLMTVKAMRCIRKADVVVYDFHVNAQILNSIKQTAEFVYAGKRGGHHEMTQEQINAVLVDRAEEGKLVCRLKGGDPFVFGRGGEEAQALALSGIEFEVIPGVSSITAVPAYAGIPLTHRGYSSTFAVITGNEAVTKPESSLYWAGLARAYETLVFLMAVRNIEAIADNLIEHGKAADTPAAVIRWGTRPDQVTITGTLGTIAQLVKDRDIRPPAVMIVGDVVRLRDVLQWYEKKPLFGYRVLITREYTPEYERLEDLGAEIFEFPTIRLAPPESYEELDRAIAAIRDYQWLIVTSSHGLASFMERFLDKGFDIRDLKGVRLCAIGEKTAEAIRRYGMKVDLVPDQFSAEGLVDAFVRLSGAAEKGNLEGVSFLLPRADNSRELFPEKIRELGGRIDTPVAYRNLKPERHGKRLKTFLMEGRITVATFTSGATFNNFLDIVGPDALPFLKKVAIAAIGPVTRKAIEKEGLTVRIMPEEATIGGMAEEIIRWATRRGTRDDRPAE